MEQSKQILHDISVFTIDLRMETIQAVMVLAKDSRSNLTKEHWNEIAQKLWQHLEKCLLKMDDQLLCATCFYSVITLADKVDYYLDKLHKIVVHGNNLHSDSQATCKQPQAIFCKPTTDINEKEQPKRTLQVVSLMYGMFQSSFLVQKRNYDTIKISQVLKEVFDLLLLMAYEYSRYTFLAFKTIKSFKKLCGGELEKYIFNKENQVKLLALVNNNWENPVTGVRDLNRDIFRTLISTLDNEIYGRLLREIDGFYWNKAKFLMLSEIIEMYNGDIISLLSDHEKWVDGLIYSLHKPGLVSAGADMYYALLKKIKSQNDWCQFFLYPVLNIFQGTSIKAIENFSNYWCLTTMKKFGAIFQVLIDELAKLEDSEKLLYSKLCVMKQANKLGVVDKNLDFENAVKNAVLTGIEYYNNHIRMLAFDIVCVSQGKSIPSQIEYDLILNYLQNNVNSDSTVLRLNMFSSFNAFLVRMHFTFINVIMKNNITEALENVLQFCKSLQSLIASNFKINGNYQRKITSVKLCNAILTSFSEIPKKRKDQTRKSNITLIAFLKDNGCWELSSEEFIMKLIGLLKDPADDIRENVIKILLSHYLLELQNTHIMQHIVADAKISMASKFFYEISCGQSMFKLITNLLIKQKEISSIEYRSVENIFDYAFNKLFTQVAIQTNVMESIETGKQLLSYMSILLVVLEECHANTYNIDISDKMFDLLYVLERISNQFAWEEEGSSDFSKMNDMVQNIIDSYTDYNYIENYDYTKSSGLQQIVLNSLWLSVKASCDLASALVQYNDDDVAICEQCLNIITRVLETSRHKGAIEAAGAALGRAIQYLTSIPEKDINTLVENDVSRLPFILLRRKLQDLISETNKMSSITRRGAGLSIMVHRIVSSDMKKGKPLFHYFLNTLLQICNAGNDGEACYQNDTTDDSIENQVDLPKAIYIHFLTRIVTDSSLATDTMYYTVQLAELAFGNLTSPHWQIRNAALQLYGALVPRLIGQKKASGTDDETTATVACDEMRTHLPQLWKYITEQLKQTSGHDIIQTHSNLVPILNVLASSAKRYNFSLHEDQDIEYYDIFPHLIQLLYSPIYTVRRLTARTIFNIYEFEFICNGIMKQEDIIENLLHGLLLLVNLCHKYYGSYPNYETAFQRLKDKLSEILNIGTHSYLCKKLFEDVYVDDIDKRDIENTLSELNAKVGPGLQIWGEARLKKYITKCSWNDVPSLLQKLLQLSDYEKYSEMVYLKLQKQHNIPNEVLLEVADVFLALEKKYSSCMVWKILYEISQRSSLHGRVKAEELFNKLEENNIYNLRYMIPLIARNIEYVNSDNESKLLKIVNDLSDFENADVDMRYIAGVANNELAHRFNKLSDSSKVISIKCAVLLLQDEDEDVRNISVKFYSILCKGKDLQPYICLNKLLNKSFLHSVFGDPQNAVQDLIDSLSDVFNVNHEIDRFNPFANDCKNIYFEPDILKQMVDTLK